MVKQSGTIRIGSGAGYAGDRLDPALELMRSANLDYIGFECLAERTIALAQLEKQKDHLLGYNHLLEYRLEKVLPLAYQNKIKVITNMGAANPEIAGYIAAEIAGKHKLKGFKIASIAGDDIIANIQKYYDLPVMETGEPLGSVAESVISANAYLGIEPILEALASKANVIITGRVADPALFLAPMVHEFGWSLHKYEKLGKGTMIGHLLECAGQVSGGYFADPGIKEVPDLWNLGFPYVEVDTNGNGFITKVDGTGGRVDRATCTEQLLYEIHDPSTYYTPDCIADFSKVSFSEDASDVIRFNGANGKAPTDSYKVSVGYLNGFLAEAEMSYGGHNCIERAQLAGSIVAKRLEQMKVSVDDLTVSLLGVNSIDLSPGSNPDVNEVRLRISGRTRQKEDAQLIVNEVEALYTNGPSAGGGAFKKVSPLVSIASVLVPKSEIQTEIIYHNL